MAKRFRRTRAAIQKYADDLITLVAEHAPASVRQIFYLAVARNLEEKSEPGYKRIVEQLSNLRLSGEIPWAEIADRSRWQRKPLTFSGARAAMEHTRRTYRRSVWFELKQRVMVVLEKDALVGVVGDVTEEYDVPLLVTRGFSSLSFVRGLAEDIVAYDGEGIHSYVYALGDWDPSGVKAHEAFDRRLKDWCPAGSYSFSRLGVTEEQIADWALPTRPTKQSTHAVHWDGGESVELDSIRPATLRELVHIAIERHVPPSHMRVLKVAEESERNILRAMTDKIPDW